MNKIRLGPPDRGGSGSLTWFQGKTIEKELQGEGGRETGIANS